MSKDEVRWHFSRLMQQFDEERQEKISSLKRKWRLAVSEKGADSWDAQLLETQIKILEAGGSL